MYLPFKIGVVRFVRNGLAKLRVRRGVVVGHTPLAVSWLRTGCRRVVSIVGGVGNTLCRGVRVPVADKVWSNCIKRRDYSSNMFSLSGGH